MPDKLSVVTRPPSSGMYTHTHTHKGGKKKAVGVLSYLTLYKPKSGEQRHPTWSALLYPDGLSPTRAILKEDGCSMGFFWGKSIVKTNKKMGFFFLLFFFPCWSPGHIPIGYIFFKIRSICFSSRAYATLGTRLNTTESLKYIHIIILRTGGYTYTV